MKKFEIKYPGDVQIYDSPSVERLEKIFLSEDKSLWKLPAGGRIQYSSPEGDEIILMYIYCFDISKVSISYTVHKKEGYFALANSDLINKFIDAHDENLVPLGSCVALNEAYIIIREFLDDPTKKPSHIQWISSDDVDYRDFYKLLGIDDDDDE
ncbi:hypothetical protein [Xenorhabdus innexi]|uniref:Uncharacterized protein n=1 Tax=Xenorhabdus innexi TaxID=290109 RepID=A0A1N6MR60_9GAMM|nr:hypothetical protein [Xenorhabdus innexi]PHM36212.1 hypothetical protein Xinn_01745 [Xenorhabdus innexi]SIP71229.1 hypothetical protein XIS1_1110006 [Xenorhabdus innexi]